MKIINKVNSSGWADWYLDKFDINFDNVRITISAPIDGNLIICCSDYIGFTIIGHWDESVIYDIKIEKYGIVTDCKKTIWRKSFARWRSKENY